MIIVRLKGGLGNQMFQYAMGRKLSLLNSDSLKFDAAGFGTVDFRSYGLSPFRLAETFASPEEIRPIKYPHGILSKLARGFSFKVLKRYHMNFEPAALRQKGDLYLDGYWQSYKYFDDIAGTIRQDFAPKTPLETSHPEIARELSGSDSISIHIRRSDYVTHEKTNRQFGTCSLAYYETAIARAAEGKANPAFFVFSDDPAWVRENLPIPHPAVYAADWKLADWQEMAAMSLCRAHIIANSSFSWWGAWLDPRADAQVFAPDRWFNNNSVIIDDIIPPTWTKLPDPRG